MVRALVRPGVARCPADRLGVLSLWIGFGLLSPLSPTPLSAQAVEECPDGTISEILLDNRSVFDLRRMDPEAFFHWAFRAANAIHMETRQDFILSELLFDVGDCHDPVLLADSERILRGHSFLADASITDERLTDGSLRIHVRTRDEWTTRINFIFSFEDGFLVEKLGVFEGNLLGRGIRAGVLLRSRRGQRDLALRFGTPRLFKTRWDAGFTFGETRTGTLFSQHVSYPFVGEVGRAGARQAYGRRESHFSYLVPGRSGRRYLRVPFREEAIEATVAGRLGRPGNLTVLGLGISGEMTTFQDFPAAVELDSDHDPGGEEVPGPRLISEVADQILDVEMVRLNVLLGRRSLRFQRRKQLDALRGTQDLAIGTEASATIGRSLPIGPSGSSDHLGARFRLYWGAAPRNWILTANLNLEGRHVFAGGRSGGGWKDLLAEADAYLYWQPVGFSGHTVFGRISAGGGRSVERPFQLTLGGRHSVRGYGEDDFPGGERVVFSLEDRYTMPWPEAGFDLGFTLFADAGRVWPGDVPFGRDSGWRASFGAGLRLGFPSGTRNIIRLDFAIPTSRTHESGRFSFRATMEELLGLLAGFGDPDITRSRRFAVGTGLLNPAR